MFRLTKHTQKSIKKETYVTWGLLAPDSTHALIIKCP